MTSLTVAIIAKDEERHLPRALESIRPIVDEIVVTDTGSTDSTVEIARKFAARVAHFPWCYDFSAAYNYCLGQVRTEWVLLLDADEELLVESHAEVRGSIDRPNALAYTVLRQDLVRPDRLDEFTEMLQLRLFRNRPDLRFIGRIHHQFSPPLDKIAAREKLQVLPSAIRLRHYGYAAGLKTEKLARAARLMEMELRDRPGQFYFLVELGRSWLALGDSRGSELIAQAAAILRDDAPRALEAGGTAAMLLEHILACDVLPANFPFDQSSAEQATLRYFPRAIPLLWQISLRRYKQQRFAECAQFLKQIVELAKSGNYDRLASFQPSLIEGDALLNLGVCYARLGRVADAKRCFTELLSKSDYAVRAGQNLAALNQLDDS